MENRLIEFADAIMVFLYKIGRQCFLAYIIGYMYHLEAVESIYRQVVLDCSRYDSDYIQFTSGRYSTATGAMTGAAKQSSRVG